MITKLGRRLALEIVGWSLVLLGIAALVLPGPGLLMLFAGLVVLSQQYPAAERILRPVEIRAKMAAAESVQTVPRVLLSSLFSLGIVSLGVVWMIGPDVPAWWPVSDDLWLAGGWPVGLSLVVSGLIALAMIAYSYKRYRGLTEDEIVAQVMASAEG